MSDSYLELLDATIQHLEDLKARGESWIQVDRALIDSLSRSPGSNRPSVAPSKRKAPPPLPSLVSAPAPVPATTPTSIADTALPTTPLPMPAPMATDFAPAPMTSSAKAAAITSLRERVVVCEKCPHLVKSRQSVVFGVGNIDSPVMFVGEAPGADEDVQGEPFVGAAGQLLTRIIKAMGFSRETVYIANVLKCRPDTPGQAYGNRKPSSEEMRTCLPYLLEQISIIQPKVIVALGGTAMEGLFGKVIGITKARGHWHTFNGTPVMPTYHPSYLLRNQALTTKREVWEDMLQVLEKLALPISEKQRNYFKAAEGSTG